MLANRMFFWNQAAWVPAPDPTITAPGSIATGGGKHTRKSEYARLSDDFWMVRERYLRRLAPAITEALPIEKANLPANEAGDILVPASGPGEGGRIILLQQVLATMLSRAQAAQNAEQLRAYASKISQLTLDIAQLRMQHDDSATTLLLLEPF